MPQMSSTFQTDSKAQNNPQPGNNNPHPLLKLSSLLFPIIKQYLLALLREEPAVPPSPARWDSGIHKPQLMFHLQDLALDLRQTLVTTLSVFFRNIPGCP